MHAYIDESKRQGKYMLCAATIVPGDVREVRSKLNQMRRGSSRIHMSDMGKRDRDPVITQVAALGLRSYIHVTKIGNGQRERDIRDAALTEVFTVLEREGVRRVVIESCDQDDHDRQAIQTVIKPGSPTEYDHAPAGANEPLLWLPDVYAWAYGRGGSTRNKVAAQIILL